MGNSRVSGSNGSNRAERARERELEESGPALRGPTPPASREAARRLDEHIEREPSARARGGDLCDFVRNGSPPRPCVGLDDTTAFVRGSGDANAIEPKDIRQGSEVGDCYLLASLASFAQTPAGRQRIHDMIHETERDGRKIYVVTFREPVNRTAAELAQGLPPYREVPVEVDRVSADRAQDGDVAGGQREIWPAVIEAAFAKYCGSLAAIAHGGAPADAMALITGTSSLEPPVAQIAQHAAAGRPCVVTIPKAVTNAQKAWTTKHGLADYHVYSVSRVFQKDGQTWVELRNPWGTHHPKPIRVQDLTSGGACLTVAR